MKYFNIFIFLYTCQAAALYDVTCWDNSCLKKGWTRTDRNSGRFSDYQCYREGCEWSGWIAGGEVSGNVYTQCKTGGCYNSGWYEIDRYTQELKQNVTCTKGDCLTYGWVSSSSTTGSVLTECEGNDCRTKGWQVYHPRGGVYAKCKVGGCFVSGWSESGL